LFEALARGFPGTYGTKVDVTQPEPWATRRWRPDDPTVISFESAPQRVADGQKDGHAAYAL